MKSPFSIIESRWYDESNDSVRPLFEAICSLHLNNPSAFFYDMFVDKYSLDFLLKKRCKDEQTKVIYLATHGDSNNIGPEGIKISRAILRNSIQEANYLRQVKGLYLGTCFTGNKSFADFILKERKIYLSWIAGYEKSVDWIEGSAIDMIFFSNYLELFKENKKKKRGKKTDLDIAKLAFQKVLDLIPTASSKYGFNFYYLEKGKVCSILASSQ